MSAPNTSPAKSPLNVSFWRRLADSAARKAPPPRPPSVSAADFEASVVGAGVPVLVEFTTPWCRPCQIAAEALADAAAQLAERARAYVLDVDAEPALADRFDVQVVPTLLFFHGGAVVERLEGEQPPQRLRETLLTLLAG